MQEHFAIVERIQARHQAEVEELRISADAAMREAEGRALDAVARKEREMEGKVRNQTMAPKLSFLEFATLNPRPPRPKP